MRKNLFFLLSISILIAFSSCSMEKRHYRNGWYSDKSKNSDHVQNNAKNSSTSDFTNEKSVPADSIVKTESKQQDSCTSEVVAKVEKEKKAGPLKEAINKIKDKNSKGDKDPNRITYSQARTQLAEKGKKPNSMAMAVYILSVASPISLLIGIGLIIAVVALILSIFATNDVIKKGECVDENLAIIDAGKRICFIFLICISILVVLFAAYMLLVWPRINGY